MSQNEVQDEDSCVIDIPSYNERGEITAIINEHQGFREVLADVLKILKNNPKPDEMLDESVAESVPFNPMNLHQYPVHPADEMVGGARFALKSYVIALVLMMTSWGLSYAAIKWFAFPLIRFLNTYMGNLGIAYPCMSESEYARNSMMTQPVQNYVSSWFFASRPPAGVGITCADRLAQFNFFIQNLKEFINNRLTNGLSLLGLVGFIDANFENIIAYIRTKTGSCSSVTRPVTSYSGAYGTPQGGKSRRHLKKRKLRTQRRIRTRRQMRK